MDNKMLKTIKEYQMLQHGDTVVVGVSGGADSMCLLHFLCTLRESMQLTIHAAHINHNLRGKESDDDQAFVEQWCSTHAVQFTCFDIQLNKETTNKGTEELGREARYKCFDALAGKTGKIATAHTLSDSCETVLFNMTRGTGIKGILGIPPVRQNIIRPLIKTTRKEVEEYCVINGLDYRTDSTNLTNDFNRNKIRNQVVPILKEINPSFEQAVLRLGKQLEAQNEVILALSEQALQEAEHATGYDCASLNKLPIAILSACVVRAAQQAGCNSMEEVHVNRIIRLIQKTQGALQLPKGYTAITNQGNFRIFKQIKDRQFFEIAVEKANGIEIYNKKIKIIHSKKDTFYKTNFVNKKFLKNILDYAIINRKAVIRTRREGDLFSPSGRGITKTVKKFFIENKVPKEKRDEVLLLAQDNEILWIEDFGVAEQARVTSGTQELLFIATEAVSSFT